jgi:NitT/TauT family transport system substrate-binding protein
MTRATLIQGALLAASTATAAAQAEKLTPIRFIATSADALRPLLYAQSAGLFRQAGLDVVMERAGTGAAAVEAVAGGANDVAMGSITSIIAAYARGVAFALVAPSIVYRKDFSTSGMMVAANSPIKSALDLQGKVVSCAAIGGISYLGLRAVIDTHGGDSSTVKWIELPNPAVTAALEQGRIDAGSMAEPNMMQDVRAGKIRYLVDELSGYGAPILEVAYFSTRDYAAKNRDTVSRFAKILARAAAYANTHVAETSPLLIPYTGMDPKVSAEMRHGFTALSFAPSQIQPVIDLMAKYKGIPQGFDAHELMSTVLS